MIYLCATLPVLSTGATEFSIPVPRKGKVVSARMSSGQVIASGGAQTIDLQRGTVSVNLITTAATYVAKTNTKGVRDAGSADLMFDPDSATVANQSITVACSQMALSGSVGLVIEFDDGANPYNSLAGDRLDAAS